jgi:hypothetical protein
MPIAAAPATPTCTIYGYVYDGAGVALEGAEVVASIASSPAYAATTVGVSAAPIKTVADTAGYFELTLMQGLVANLKVSAMGYNKKVTVPASANVEFSTL